MLIEYWKMEIRIRYLILFRNKDLESLKKFKFHYGDAAEKNEQNAMIALLKSILRCFANRRSQPLRKLCCLNVT